MLLQVAKLPMQTLEARFGDRASWIHDAVRGISDEPVQVSAGLVVEFHSQAQQCSGPTAPWLT
jgi:nucleotidyltransferase/DNA polymerase involved in DNA repair